MQTLRASALALVLIFASAPAIAGTTQDEVERLAREAADRIVAALSIILLAIPQYEMPELLPDGDIIIRRKHRQPPSEEETPRRKRPGEPPADNDVDQTET